MSEVDPRMAAAVSEQLARRATGATRIGWKIGRGDRESMGGEIPVGHLTSATILEPGATYRGGGGNLHADAELALELGEEERIVGYGVALELVDLGGSEDPAAVVARNVFHRAVAFGPIQHTLPPGLQARLVVDGDLRAAAPVAEDPVGTVRAAARLLNAVGQQLRGGDRLIAGSIVQVRVAAGAVVAADMGELGRVELAVA